MDLPRDQNLEINLNNKLKYGEVHTPYALIEKMLSLLPEDIFSDPSKRWLDPGAGRGYFSLYLFEKLNKGLESTFPDKEKRERHIAEKMIWLVELNEEHKSSLEHLFTPYKSNLIHTNFLTYNPDLQFDVVLGNPPFNQDGIKKVPTNNTLNKKQDGKTIWAEFIKRSLYFLKPSGLLLFIVPSIWMKEDKQGMYFYMTQFKIHKIHCLTNTEMNKFFKGHAQTPSCYFLLEKKSTNKKVLLFDKDRNVYVDFPLRSENILPVECAAAIKELLPFVDKYGSLSSMLKSNLPSKHITFSRKKDKNHLYPNIKTCILTDKVKPELVIEYSSKPCAFYGKRKLVLAHGMYGFPFIDKNGKYGISNRDKYVYLDNNLENLEKLGNFLSTDLAFYVFNATRYRMKYLEKYIFSYLPNVINMEKADINKLYSIVCFKKNKYKPIT